MKAPRSIVVHLPSKFREIKRPKFADTLVFPVDITELTSANISDLHAKYTELYTWANQELTKANIAILRLTTKEARLRSQIFVDNPRINQIDRWRRDAVIDADSEIQDIHQELNLWRVEKEFAQMSVVNYDKYINALSRELSRKTAEGR